MDAINDGLFKQAYTASVDVNKLLKKYEISKILNEPYDKEGASLTVESGSGGIYNEVSEQCYHLIHTCYVYDKLTSVECFTDIDFLMC